MIRSGVPVAVIMPPKAQLVSAERFRDLMSNAPRPDGNFAEVLRTLREEAGSSS